MKLLKDFTDQQLVEYIETGGTKREIAWKYIYEDSGISQKVIALLRKQGADEEDSKEILQEACAITDKNIRQKKFEGKSSLSTYIIGVSRNCLFTWFKNKKKVENAETEFALQMEESDTNENYEAMNERDEKMNRLFNQSTDKCKEILVLRLEGFDLNDIADKLEIEYQSVKNRMHRCFKSLRQMIEDDPTFWSA